MLRERRQMFCKENDLPFDTVLARYDAVIDIKLMAKTVSDVL